MRSGLSLRIPGMKELSPARNSGKSASQSLSFIKPSSPKPSESKNHQRTPTHSSAYSRITSSMTIKKLSLPSFLRINQNDREDLLQKLPLGKSVVSQASDCPTEASSNKPCIEDSKNTTAKSQVAQTTDEFIAKIFKKGSAAEEVLLKVGKIELTRGELQSLQPKSLISRNIIDACLRCIKHRNRKLFKKTEAHDRVLIINTSFSQHIFGTSKEPKMYCKRNPLKYEYVLFPLYVGFWILLTLDNRQKKLYLYNLSRKDPLVEQIFSFVKDFVKRELKRHENKEIEITGWRELSYDILDYGRIDEVDSSAFAIRVAYKLAINQNAVINCDVIHEFRCNLIVMLYKHGNQICH